MRFYRFALLGLSAAASIVSAAVASTPGQVAVQSVTHSPGIAPKFAVIHRLVPNFSGPRVNRALPPTWVFSYAYGGSTYNETFVGTNPSGGASTTVPIYIVPLKLVAAGTSEDPTAITQNGVSIVQNVINSPVLSSNVTYTEAGTNLGTTQYLDAFQKMNLWGVGGSNSGYHVLLGKPVVEPVQTLSLTSRQGSVQSPFGQKVIAANINTVDSKINTLIGSLGIPSNAFPIFVTVNAYLYQGSYNSGCCIGGYHSVTSAGQPYTQASFITQTGNFAEDVSALSHEVGEWVDDPNTNNPVPPACGSGAILEVGDPLEGNANYGTYTYTAGGVTWHLQDLVTLPYFGAPTSTTLAGRSTFQGETIAFCSNGG